MFAWALRKEAMRQGIPVNRRDMPVERKIFWRFALPAAAAGLTSMPAIWLAQAYLARQQGGFTELALYSAANNLRIIVLFIPIILNNVGVAVLNNQLGAMAPDQYRRMFWVIFACSGLLAAIGSFAVGLAGPRVLTIFGREFVDGYPVLAILLLSTIIEACSIAGYQIIYTHERMWFSLFFVTWPRDATVLLLGWALIPTWGARGLAMSYGASWVVAMIVISMAMLHLGVRPRR
jgi:O-antigen/teichoic acid export membrane protein